MIGAALHLYEDDTDVAWGPEYLNRYMLALWARQVLFARPVTGIQIAHVVGNERSVSLDRLRSAAWSLGPEREQAIAALKPARTPEPTILCEECLCEQCWCPTPAAPASVTGKTPASAVSAQAHGALRDASAQPCACELGQSESGRDGVA